MLTPLLQGMLGWRVILLARSLASIPPSWVYQAVRFRSLNLSSHSVMSDSLRSRGLEHARLLCPSPSPRVCSNSCPLSRWCHPTVSSLSLPSSPAFYLSQHLVFLKELAFCTREPKYWSFSISPSNVFSGFSLGLMGLILLSKGFWRVFPSTTTRKHHSLVLSLL